MATVTIQHNNQDLGGNHSMDAEFKYALVYPGVVLPGNCGLLGAPKLTSAFLKALLGIDDELAKSALMELKTNNKIRLLTKKYGEVRITVQV